MRMTPSEQRLYPCKRVVSQANLRLVPEFEFVVRKRVAQVRTKAMPLFRPVLHNPREEGPDAASAALRAIERQVRAGEKLLHIGRVLPRHGDSDAGAVVY